MDEQATILIDQIRSGTNGSAEISNLNKQFKGIDDKDVIVLYPNPATDFINIETNKTGAAIFILHEALRTLPSIANGLYSCKIKFNDETFIGKLNVLK